MKWLIVSVVGHIILILLLTLSIQKKEKKQNVIEVEIKEVHATDKIKKNRTLPINFNRRNKHLSSGKRIGSKESNATPRTLGQELELENYLERLRDRIEPNWITLLRRDVPTTKQQRRRSCLVVLNIETTPDGQILDIDMIRSCGWQLAENDAVKAIQISGIIPPPKEYLVNGIFYLQWAFDLRM